MENSLQSFDIASKSEQRYYTLTVSIAVLVTVSLFGFFLYFASKAFRQLLNIQRKVEAMFANIRLDYIRSIRVNEPQSKPKSKQGKILRKTFEGNLQEVMQQKHSLLEFNQMFKLLLHKYNYFVYYLQKRCEKRSSKGETRLKVLQVRSTLKALLQWYSLLIIWLLSNTFAAIGARLSPNASLLAITFVNSIIVSILSSISGICLTLSITLFYEKVFENQVLSIFRAKPEWSNQKLNLSVNEESFQNESELRLFFGQERRYQQKDVRFQNPKLIAVIFVNVLICSFVFSICLYQQMILDQTFKAAALLVFIISPLLDVVVFRNFLVAIMAHFKNRQRKKYIQLEVFSKNKSFRGDIENQSKSVFEIADSFDSSLSQNSSNRSRLKNSILPFGEFANQAGSDHGCQSQKASNIDSIFQNMAFYYEQSKDYPQFEDLNQTYSPFQLFKRKEMMWLEDKMKFYDLVLLSYVDQTYGCKGGYKIVKTISSAENFLLIEKLKQKVFNVVPINSNELSFESSSVSAMQSFATDLRIDEKSFARKEESLVLDVVEEVNEDMEQTYKQLSRKLQRIASGILDRNEDDFENTAEVENNRPNFQIKENETQSSQKVDEEEAIQPVKEQEIKERLEAQVRKDLEIEIHQSENELVFSQSEKGETEEDDSSKEQTKNENVLKDASSQINKHIIPAKPHETRLFSRLSLNLEKLKKETIRDLENIDQKKRRVRRRRMNKIGDQENRTVGDIQLESNIKIKGRKRVKKEQKTMGSSNQVTLKHKSSSKKSAHFKGSSCKKSMTKSLSNSSQKHSVRNSIQRFSLQSIHKSLESQGNDHNLWQNMNYLINPHGQRAFNHKRYLSNDANQFQISGKNDQFIESISNKFNSSEKEGTFKSYRSSQSNAQYLAVNKNPYAHSNLSPYREDLTKMITRNQSRNSSCCNSDRSRKSKRSTQSINKSKVQISQECLDKYYMYNEKQVRPRTGGCARNSKSIARTQRRLSQEQLSCNGISQHHLSNEYDLNLGITYQHGLYSHQVSSRSCRRNSLTFQPPTYIPDDLTQISRSVEAGQNLFQPSILQKDQHSFLSNHHHVIQQESFGGTTANSFSGPHQQQIPSYDIVSGFDSRFNSNQVSLQRTAAQKSIHREKQSISLVRTGDNSYFQNIINNAGRSGKKKKNIQRKSQQAQCFSQREHGKRVLTKEMRLSKDNSLEKKLSEYRLSQQNPLSVQEEYGNESQGRFSKTKMKANDIGNDYLISSQGNQNLKMNRKAKIISKKGQVM